MKSRDNIIIIYHIPSSNWRHIHLETHVRTPVVSCNVVLPYITHSNRRYRSIAYSTYLHLIRICTHAHSNRKCLLYSSCIRWVFVWIFLSNIAVLDVLPRNKVYFLQWRTLTFWKRPNYILFAPAFPCLLMSNTEYFMWIGKHIHMHVCCVPRYVPALLLLQLFSLPNSVQNSLFGVSFQSIGILLTITSLPIWTPVILPQTNYSDLTAMLISISNEISTDDYAIMTPIQRHLKILTPPLFVPSTD